MGLLYLLSYGEGKIIPVLNYHTMGPILKWRYKSVYSLSSHEMSVSGHSCPFASPLKKEPLIGIVWKAG
jgi:hypothetical protein